MSINVETYTTENGSNMDAIEYRDGMTVDEIATDLMKRYEGWDYAIAELSDGTTATIERRVGE